MSAEQAEPSELDRIRSEYARRSREIGDERYAPWNTGEAFIAESARRLAPVMLYRAGRFPKTGSRCLEIGYGTLGWLGNLINWGLRAEDLCGIELLADRAARAKAALPGADLRVGDATELPWPDASFALIVVSTVFTSILDSAVRRGIAAEVRRCLAPGGALLWYDFAVDNPRNPHVKAVTKREVRSLFVGLSGEIRRVTLAPPLARLVAPRSWPLAVLLESLPWLRTHLMAVLVKEEAH